MGKPTVLQSMRLQRDGCDLATEQDFCIERSVLFLTTHVGIFSSSYFYFMIIKPLTLNPSVDQIV